MWKSWIKKAIVCGIICLFIETSVVLGICEKNYLNGQLITVNQNTQLPISFTLIALPDTQNYVSLYPDIFTSQTQWIVTNREILNIVYVGHEGDIVNTARSTNQWDRANKSISYLEDPITTGLTDGIPYSMIRGNHDIGKLFDQYFGVARFTGRSYYGGQYSDNNQNNYVLFDVGDLHYISISLDYDPDTNELNWMESILQTYSDRKAIVISHSILNNPVGDWTTPGLNIYNTVKNYPNVFLMLCGHKHYEARRKDIYNGNTIHTLLADYQDYPNGGNGWLRIMEVWPVTNQIKVKTYSPYLNLYKNDPDSEFTLFYDQDTNQPPPTITGPVKGTAGVTNDYNFTATNPEGYKVYYFIDWGDNTNIGWIGPFPSGIEQTSSHTWNKEGKYIIRVKARDIHGTESDWATLTVSMPKTYIYSPIIQIILKMLEPFPIFEKILNLYYK